MTTATAAPPVTTYRASSASVPVRTPDAAPTTAELAILRHVLEQQQCFRREQLAAFGRRHLAATAAHDEVAASLAAGARSALRDITAALQRMDDGRYGRCVDCGEPVGLEQLEILPRVAHCVRCQRADRASVTEPTLTGAGVSR